MSHSHPRRIAHVISTPRGVGGAERVLQALVRGGADRGWDQLVLNPFALGDENPYPEARVMKYPAKRVVQIPAIWRWTQRHVREFSPHVLHAHLFHALVVVAALPRDTWRSVLSHQHGNHLQMQGRRFSRMLDRRAGSRIDRVVAISDFVYRYLREEYRYPESKLALIRNGWEGQPRSEESRPSEPTAICIANFRPEKGHNVLLDAFSRVLQEIPGARLILVGEGPLRADLEAQVGRSGLLGNVEFTGAVHDVWPHLARANVFVLPSRSEALGVVLMEAMAAGLPIVASDVGGVPELVKPGINGELVRPGDASDLSHRLTVLLRAPDLQIAIGERNRQAAEGWRVDLMVTRYFELYEELLR